MSELTIDEKLNKYAKESKNIEYTTKVFEKTSEEREEPKVILRQLIDDNENNMWTIILKYKTLDNLPQEVIMGTLDNTPQRKDKAIEIMALIIKQLKENVLADSGYEYYEKLSQYVRRGSEKPSPYFAGYSRAHSLLLYRAHRSRLFRRSEAELH